MFDVGFSELALIGVIALIILGPDRLPKAARTAGLWVGRARRMLADVKADIDREVRRSELEEIKDIGNEIKKAGEEIKESAEVLNETIDTEPETDSIDQSSEKTADKSEDNSTPDETPKSAEAG